MRRAVLFFLLFSSGLLLLVLLDRSTREPTVQELNGEEAPLDEALAGTQTVEVAGYTKMEFFDAETGLVLRQFEADNLEPKGEGMVRPYLATGLTVLEYEQGSTDLLRRVESDSADLVLDLGAGLGGPQLGDSSRIQLHGVTLRQLRALPQAPLVVTSPEVVAELDEQVYITESVHQVKVAGQGLSAEGRGLIFDARRGRLEFPMGGTFDLLREGAQRGVLSTALGTPLILEQQGGDRGERFEITADGPSVLVIVQDEELQLDAEYLHVETRVGDEGVEVDRIRVRGPVVVTRGLDRFGGVDALVAFQSDGSLRLEVQNAPWVEFGGIDPESEASLVIMRGKGPMWAIENQDGLRFGMDSNANFEGPGGVRVEANGGFRGRMASDQSHAALDLLGAVFMNRADLELSTSNASMLVAGDDLIGVHLHTTERLQMITKLPGGSSASFTAIGGADVQVQGADVRVPHALEVEVVALEGPKRQLNCNELIDLSLDLRTFIARGNVRWLAPEGTASAEWMRSRGDEIELQGKLGQKARLVWIGAGLQEAELEAERIVVSDIHVEAWEGVRADLSLDETALGLRCEHTRIDRQGKAFRWLAESVSESVWSQEALKISLAAGVLEVEGKEKVQADGKSLVEVARVQVREDVQATIAQANTVNVLADVLNLVPNQSILVEALPGREITTSGQIPGTEMPFTVYGTSMTVDQDEVRLYGVHGSLEGALLPVSPGAPKDDAEVRKSSDFAANSFWLTRTGLELEGEVYIESADFDGNPLSLSAHRITSGYNSPSDGLDLSPVDIQFIEAIGNVRAVYGGLARLEADELSVNHERMTLRGSPLLLRSGESSLETTEVTFDLADYLIDAQEGIIRQGTGWSLAFGGATAVRRGGGLMQTMSSLVHVDFVETSRAEHMAIWLHPSRWRALVHERLWGAPLELDYEDQAPVLDQNALHETKLVNNTFQRLARGELASYVRAFHLQGSIELEREGIRLARAEEVYLDLENRRGWLNESELGFEIEMRGQKQRLRAFSARLDSLPNGGLVASDATLTACSHEVPHYVIQTSDLRLEPRADGRWKFGVRGNRLMFPGGFSLPLPGIGSVVLDEAGGFEGLEDDEGRVRTIQNIFLSSTARFGTALGTAGTTDIGAVGQSLAEVFGFGGAEGSGKWKYEGAWLGSRGPLLGMGLLLRDKRTESNEDEVYWLNLWARGIYDEGEDRGVLRVDDRSDGDTRLWLNARGRYPFDDRQWIDVVANYQTDPGVQAEFYEREYLAYEERDTYVHWRKARDGHYFNAQVSAQGNSFRSAVLERPSLGFYRGAAEVGRLFNHSLLYSASVDAASLHRLEGDLQYESPFLGLDGAPDGLGDRRVTRIDTRHGLALPMSLGKSGVQAIPTLDLQATAWDRSVDAGNSIGRSGAFAGLELGGSWARVSNSSATSVAPFVSHREELLIDEHPEEVVLFDELDQPIGGSRSQAGLHLRWTRPASNDDADFQIGLERLHGSPQGLAGADSGHFLGSLGTTAFGVPIGFRHDGRYLLDQGQTAYSKSTFAIKPVEWVEFQLSHDRALQVDQTALYEAITYRGRITVDSKWEIDALAQESIFGGESLRTELLLRRIGHDFVFELGFFHREGEGSGVKVNLAPLIGWTRSRVSILSLRPERGGG